MKKDVKIQNELSILKKAKKEAERLGLSFMIGTFYKRKSEQFRDDTHKTPEAVRAGFMAEVSGVGGERFRAVECKTMGEALRVALDGWKAGKPVEVVKQ